MLSRRTAWDRTENALTARVAAARARGQRLIDLTETNPTRVDLVDARPQVALLGHPRGAVYEPASLGHASAREAVARYVASRGGAIDPAHVVLAASTSELYAWLFQLLCDAGDRVLVPRPSYPLFQWLAGPEGVELDGYPLVREAGFRVDLDALERAVRPTTRALLLVSPNNPTGTFVRRDEAEALVALAARHDLAIVADEVFGDFVHGALAADRLPTFAGTEGALTFALGGLSKVCLLPQLKLGWGAVSGPRALVDEALARLEVLADTYLSVSTPVQLALPELLDARGPTLERTRARLAANLAAIDRAIAAGGPSCTVRRLPTDGGWTAILEVPRVLDEDGWARLLLDEQGVVVQPGWFYDLDRDGFLVVSLIVAEAAFAEGIGRLVAAVDHASR